MLASCNALASQGTYRHTAPFSSASQSRPVRLVSFSRPLVQRCQATAEVNTLVKKPEGVAHLRFQRGSVFKVRRVLDTIRGRSYEDAILMMEYMPYRACEPILDCLTSAAANAKNNNGAMKSKLYVSEAFADQGPYMKRFQPRAQGRAYRINKPTFHLSIRVSERE